MMFRWFRYRWEEFILRQWHKYYTVGGHCGLCGKWIDDAVVDKYWRISMCEDWETGCFNHPLGETTNE